MKLPITVSISRVWQFMSGGLGTRSTFCVLFNLVIGAMLLSLPSAFQVISLPVSLVLLLVFALISWLLHLELLEITEELSHLKPMEGDEPLLQARDLEIPPKFWDLPAIVSHVLGDGIGSMYGFLYMVLLWTIISLYIMLSGESFSCLFHCYENERKGGECAYYYHFGTIISAITIGIFAGTDFLPKKRLHITLSCFQFLFIILLISYAVYHPYGEAQTSVLQLPDVVSFFDSLGVVAVACIYQVCMPSVIAGSKKRKKAQKQVALWMFLSIVVVYGGLSCVLGYLWGDVPETIAYFFYVMEEPWFLWRVAVFGLLTVDFVFNTPIYCQALTAYLFTTSWCINPRIFQASNPTAYKFMPSFTVIPALLISSFIPSSVRSRQEYILLIVSVLSVLTTMVFLPVCYNHLLRSGKKVKLRVGLKGVKGVNYVLAGVGVVVCGAMVLGKVWAEPESEPYY